MAGVSEGHLEKAIVNEFLHADLKKVLDQQDEEEESSQENSNNDEDEDEDENQITRNINKRFVLANRRHLISRNLRTINNDEQNSSDDNSDQTNEPQASCSTKKDKQISQFISTMLNQDDSARFTGRFSGASDNLHFEKPKPYFEYNKLTPLQSSRAQQSASCYDRAEEDSDETTEAKHETGKKSRTDSSNLKLTTKLNPDDYFLSEDDETDSSYEEYNSLSKASARACGTASASSTANRMSNNRQILLKRSNDSSELTSTYSSTSSSTYPSMDLTTINTNYIIPLRESDQEDAALSPTNNAAETQQTEK